MSKSDYAGILLSLMFITTTTTALSQATWHPTPPNPSKEHTGAIVGGVKDPTGPVKDATVTLKDSVTDEVRTARSDDRGHYEFRELLPGVYSLQAKKSDKNQVSEVKQVKVNNAAEETINLSFQ